MSRREATWHIFEALDLEFVESIFPVSHGRRNKFGGPHRNLVGMFKVEPVKRPIRVGSYDELYWLLRADAPLNIPCLIKDWEKPNHPSTVSRLRRRIESEGSESPIKHLVKQLHVTGVTNVETSARCHIHRSLQSKRTSRQLTGIV